jgi:redox-sensitive bicupin YhaK (pirin superfamily)
LLYVLSGEGTAGAEQAPVREGQLAVFGPGASLSLAANERQPAASPNLDVLVLGGRPIREPVVAYGPFVMNTRDEIVQAIEDYQSGRMGSIPPLPSQ